MTSITTWAQHVQPGSPSSPSHSHNHTGTQRPRKHRRPSISRLHLNLAPSLPALPKHARARSGSASFLHILDTPSTSGSAVVVTPSPTHPALTSANGNVNGMNGMNNTPTTPKSSPLHAHGTADFDLTALGYTSLFLRLPTPATPHYPTYPTHNSNTTLTDNNNSTHNHNNDSTSTPNTNITNTTDHTDNNAQPKGNAGNGNIKAAFARLRARSFSALLRPRKPTPSANTPSSPRVGMDVPPVPAIPAKYLTTTPIKTKDVKNKEKKKEKAKKPKKHALPPTLASELALLQFLDGGSLEDNIAALSHSTLKNSSSLKNSSTTNTNNSSSPYSSYSTKNTAMVVNKGASNKGVVGVGGEWVYTDAAGRVWRDADEALEYAHLLAPSPTSPTYSYSYSPTRSVHSPNSPSYSYVLNTPNSPRTPSYSGCYSPAFSIVSISFPSPSLPSTPRSFEAKEKAGAWITFTAYSPSSPSFPPPTNSSSTSTSSPFSTNNSNSFNTNSLNKFTRHRKYSVGKRNTSMRRELATRRRGSLVRRVPRTPPCTELPPAPYSDIDTDVEMDGNGKAKRMGMAGLGFWAI